MMENTVILDRNFQWKSLEISHYGPTFSPCTLQFLLIWNIKISIRNFLYLIIYLQPAVHQKKERRLHARIAICLATTINKNKYETLKLIFVIT